MPVGGEPGDQAAVGRALVAQGSIFSAAQQPTFFATTGMVGSNNTVAIDNDSLADEPSHLVSQDFGLGDTALN